MKPVYQCLSCLVGQAVRVVEMSCEEKDREPLLKSFFARLSQADLPGPRLISWATYLRFCARKPAAPIRIMKPAGATTT